MSKLRVRVFFVIFLVVMVFLTVYIFLNKDVARVDRYSQEKERADVLVTFILGEYDRQISAYGSADIKSIIKDANKLKNGSIDILHRKDQPTIVLIDSFDRVLARVELDDEMGVR